MFLPFLLLPNSSLKESHSKLTHKEDLFFFILLWEKVPGHPALWFSKAVQPGNAETRRHRSNSIAADCPIPSWPCAPSDGFHRSQWDVRSRSERGRGITVSLVLGCLSSWFDSHAIARHLCGMRVTQWGSFLRRGVPVFFESVAYGKAVMRLVSRHRSPVEGAGLLTRFYLCPLALVRVMIYQS